LSITQEISQCSTLIKSVKHTTLKVIHVHYQAYILSMLLTVILRPVSNRTNRAGMTSECQQFLTVSNIPQTHCLVSWCCQQLVVI